MKRADNFELAPQREWAEAAEKGRMRVMDDLLRRGADVNLQRGEGMTALILGVPTAKQGGVCSSLE